LYRAVQNMRNPRPICEEPLKLMLGAGVAMQPEWQADIDAGHCVPAPDALEAPA